MNYEKQIADLERRCGALTDALQTVHTYAINAVLVAVVMGILMVVLPAIDCPPPIKGFVGTVEGPFLIGFGVICFLYYRGKRLIKKTR